MQCLVRICIYKVGTMVRDSVEYILIYLCESVHSTHL